jgi:hypothetical protein
MDSPMNYRAGGAFQRQLAHLKLISRLLGHELHAQSSTKSITLSRDEVQEIQTSLDLFIEEVGRTGGAPSTMPAETTLVGSRN